MCMFPNSHAEFVSDFPDSGEYILSELEEYPDKVISKITIYKGGKVFSDSEESCISKSFSEEDKKRAVSRAIKISFYNAALPMLERKPAWGALTGVRPSKVAAGYIERGFSFDAAKEALKKEYFVSDLRAELAARCALRAKEVSSTCGKKDFSLYVGIPFCASRCRYCSFVSHSIEKARSLVAPYLEVLSQELEALANAVRENGLSLRSIYIGGGTPTALTNEELRFVMQKIGESFDVSKALEYTVEGGRPDTITREKIKTIKEYGATRISVNPQTMNDDILKAMDRRHTAEDVIRTIEVVRDIGGLVINADLIAGLPGDNFESFSNSIERLLLLEPENITVHTLAIKKGSNLSNEKYMLPQGSETEKMVDYAMSRVIECGYAPYYLYRQKYMSGNLENVGYSKPGFESAYNNYIMDELHTILSAGAGGVTKLIDSEEGRIERIFNPKYPYEYNNAIEKIKLTQNKISEFFGEREG